MGHYAAEMIFEDQKPEEKAKSRQQVWQEKMFEQGRCVTCGNPRKKSRFKRHCSGCGKKASDKVRERKGCKKWRPGGPGRPPHSSVIAREAAERRKKGAA